MLPPSITPLISFSISAPVPIFASAAPITLIVNPSGCRNAPRSASSGSSTREKGRHEAESFTPPSSRVTFISDLLIPSILSNARRECFLPSENVSKFYNFFFFSSCTSAIVFSVIQKCLRIKSVDALQCCWQRRYS